MKLYSYIITRDYGFAPNPYGGMCTLATCKPVIRRKAQIGDWVAAIGGSSTPVSGKVVMLMQVQDACSYDEYWMNEQYRKKKPVFNRSMNEAYGDNIYHHVDGKWYQELSHHSKDDGSVNYVNLDHDTGTDRVLISDNYYYFGNNAIDIPDEFSALFRCGRGHGVNEDTALINDFIRYVHNNYLCGINGTPFNRRIGEFAHYKGEQ
ncbi:MAG: hypothetical protein IJV15_14250 [Lachnospiraceae bacterium]|nr:hypothetical protein [Lachnospiraceae bacterium]MBR1598638.1 hypothetical protein [Lachnospiraceae bacterium]